MDEQTTERATDQATAQRIIGARIREFREAAGLSQAELARRVYVSRQTVGNWEAGRTLADVQSLVLLGQVFGTTVDAIIGEKGARAVRSTANERHELLRLLAHCATLLVVCIVLVFVRYLLSPLRNTNPTIEPLRDLMFLVIIACEAILALRAVPRLRAFMREHDLAGAVAATAFLEGRNPAEEVPHDFLFRWFIPYWKVWLVAIVAVALVAVALYVGELP
ncbi:helix-turn-helix transcriptional regulator [Olsenella sp. An293]|uniref:helix-turn-helix domain-containing protein n=1 Tax=Olsenella sp. An293 TaxID=1965626 RepID=UPI000B36C52C|nr:helix-turn-helix transcriptional regulator [Olsenella sp. An293]OUO31666.1 hypothetical protein B5F85_09735 [Olsenella sp. An293]